MKKPYRNIYEESIMQLFTYCVLFNISKIMFHSIRLQLEENKLDHSYDETYFIEKMVKLVMRK